MLRILRNSLQQIVTNSQNWIENLEESAAAFAFTKLGDKIFIFLKPSAKLQFNQDSTSYRYKGRWFTIFLSGYVLHKSTKKSKKNINLLKIKNCILFQIIPMNDELLIFFTITEETFQKKTVNLPH